MGHDPVGILAGTYDQVLPNSIPALSELADCRVAAPFPGSTPTW